MFEPNVLAALLTVSIVVVVVMLAERALPKTVAASENETDVASELTILNIKNPETKTNDQGIGKGGKSPVGFQNGSGEGSGEVRRRAQGGGGSGLRDQLPAQVGKLPPPSPIVAAIPKTAPVLPSLPVAGIDIDPALWKDIKSPVYGDPLSKSNQSSRGPGEGGAFGSGRGLGFGEGDGSGVGPGKNGNMGDGDKQTGCCGSAGSNGNNASLEAPHIFKGTDVEQRARLISKPEPQFTEEARRNQITGTVMLRVVFTSSGQVEQIRAVQTLPFGLTEKAIAAARQIRFQPATKGGRPVSVYMQLEYNFNLY